MTDASPALIREHSPAGDWEIIRRVPHPSLRGIVRDEYVGYREDAAAGRRMEVPHPGIVLIVNLGSGYRIHDPRAAGRNDLFGSFVAGLHDAQVFTEARGASLGIQVNFTPLGAFRFLGRGAGALANQVVELRAALGVAADEIADRLAGTPEWGRRFDLLDAWITTRIARTAAPSAHVAGAWRRLADSRGAVAIGALAGDVGISRKHLHALFHDHMGTSPKLVARILRFDRAVQLLRRGRARRWSELALHCGYFDQSHLIRDFTAFTGTTPVDFASRLLPNGSVIGD